MKSSVWKRNRAKILVAIAALLIALAAAYGSGAFFTATAQNNGNVFTAGTLSLTPAGASLNVGPLFPGNPLSGTMMITNTNPVDSELYLSQSALSESVAGFINEVNVTVSGPSGVLWSGHLNAFPASLDVGLLSANTGSATVTWDVELPETGVNQDVYQGATMSCNYTWTLVSQ